MVKLLCSWKAAGYLILVSLMIDTGSQHNVVFDQAFCSETFRKKSFLTLDLIQDPAPTDNQTLTVSIIKNQADY